MKEIININNYEQYAIDYVEGNLSGELLDAFRAFLIANPAIDQEIHDLIENDLSVEPSGSTLGFDGSSIKFNIKPTAHIDESNYEEYFAHSVGKGELNQSMMKELNDFVDANEFLRRDYKLYQLSKLEADESVVFENKGELKQPIPLWQITASSARVYYRIAASLAILLGIWAALRTLETQTYVPREAGHELEIADVSFRITPVETKQSKHVSPDHYQPVTENVVIAPEAVDIAVMPVVNDQTEDIALDENVEQLPVLVASIPDPISEKSLVPTHTYGTQELTVLQYLGKRFLNINPNESKTNKEVLKRGFESVLNKTDVVAMNEEVTTNKKTFQLMAGAFEYKRVNYNR